MFLDTEDNRIRVCLEKEGNFQNFQLSFGKESLGVFGGVMRKNFWIRLSPAEKERTWDYV